MHLFFISLILIASYQVKSQNPVIKNRQSLINYAGPILFKTYGKKKIRSEKPYVVSFKNGIWTMDGALKETKGYDVVGGTFYIEINAKDGKVIKLIHYK